MFYPCLSKSMIKPFFLSSSPFSLASLIMENYNPAVNIPYLGDGSTRCIWFPSARLVGDLTFSGANFSY